jgi:hypothetical protein
MAAWQTLFHVVPRRALTLEPQPALTAARLDAADWWADATLPHDYRARLSATAPAGSQSPDRETWGAEDGNFIEVLLANGHVRAVRVRVDVRRPDAKFAAGVITFARAAGAVLVRADGSIVEATAGGFGLALRGSAAWRAVYG